LKKSRNFVKRSSRSRMRSRLHNRIMIWKKRTELQYGKLPQLQKQLEVEEEEVKNKDLSLVHENVSEEEIARIISRWTGIPVAKLTESERNKTLHLDEELHKRVIGQDEPSSYPTYPGGAPIRRDTEYFSIYSLISRRAA